MMNHKLVRSVAIFVGVLFGALASRAATNPNWTTAYCYTNDADAQPIVYLGAPNTDNAGSTRPVILIATIPANQNQFDITGEAPAGYYEGHDKVTLVREKTVINMSEHLTGANQPNTGVFFELSLPVLQAPVQGVESQMGTLTLRLGEDEEGFEGTAFGTMSVKCDLRS